jgi:hypothetical protein
MDPDDAVELYAADGKGNELKGHVSGGLPMITDAVFSVIVVFYVSLSFCFVYFMFCWGSTDAVGKRKPEKQCVLMAVAEAEKADKE